VTALTALLGERAVSFFEVPSGVHSARSHNDRSCIVPRTWVFFKLDFLSLFQRAEIELSQATAMEEYLPPIFGTDEPEPVGVVYCLDCSVHLETSVRLDGLDAQEDMMFAREVQVLI
jgi:hypothetical protein